jgi:pyruvate formate lyase activating enzyme
MTLLDFPGRIACTVFLSGCDMRCPFCHNSELAAGKAPPVMTSGELMTFLAKRKGMLDGVAVTGGEPLLREETLDLLREIRGLGYPVKLDTNGTHPDRLRRAVEEDLAQYVAMDIKNSPDLYVQTAGAPVQLQKIEESIRFLTEEHLDYEFRTTVVAQLHDCASIARMGEWVAALAQGKKIKRWFVQPFADRDTVLFTGLSSPDDEQLSEFVTLLQRFSIRSSIRG